MTNPVNEALKRTFLELVAIDGVYPQEHGTIEYTKARLRNYSIPFQEDSFGNVIVKISGHGEPILLSTHFDIPEPNPEQNPKIEFTPNGEEIISARGENILGADPKTGLAILIEFLVELSTRNHQEHTPVEVVLTRGEEAGLLGARNLDFSLISAKFGLVLDEDGPVTNVVIQSPAYVSFKVEFLGKSAHPREPEKGINALNIACEALTAIPCGFSVEGVIWNIGLFKAGTARNTIPGKATLEGELRSYDTQLVKAEAKRIEESFCEIAGKYNAPMPVIEWELGFESYKLAPQGFLFSRLGSIYKDMCLEPNYYATFGASDANVFNSHGICVVPIGSAYYNAHQKNEFANIDEMAEIMEFLRRFVAD